MKSENKKPVPVLHLQHWWCYYSFAKSVFGRRFSPNRYSYSGESHCLNFNSKVFNFHSNKAKQIIGMESTMDKVVEEVEKLKKQWDETYTKTQEHIHAIAEYGKLARAKEETNSLARLNGIAQDGLALLSSFVFTLDLLAPQLPSQPEVQSARALLQSWKTLTQKYTHSLSFSTFARKWKLKSCLFVCYSIGLNS